MMDIIRLIDCKTNKQYGEVHGTRDGWFSNYRIAKSYIIDEGLDSIAKIATMTVEGDGWKLREYTNENQYYVCQDMIVVVIGLEEINSDTVHFGERKKKRRTQRKPIIYNPDVMYCAPKRSTIYY